MDKATPARNTFQCVLIIAVYNGEKCVFPVGAPLVYRPPSSGEQAENSDERELHNLAATATPVAEDNDDDAVDSDMDDEYDEVAHENVELPIIVGGKSSDLASDISKLITERFHFTKCDLQYLAGNNYIKIYQWL